MGTSTCEHCNARFIVGRNTTGRFCRHKCSSDFFAASFNARFWARVNKNGPVPMVNASIGKCWLWTGSTDGRGYGTVGRKRADGSHGEYKTHRIAYELSNGAVPAIGVVMHECDNRICCNPSHLAFGTQKKNLLDAVDRGRIPLGEKHHLAKLTDNDVSEMIKRRSCGESQRSIGDAFGVHRGYVSLIVRGIRRTRRAIHDHRKALLARRENE